MAYKKLSIKSLPAPSIKLPNDYFQIYTHTGSNYLHGTQTRITAGSKTITRSLRFNDDDSAYLSRTPGGAGNRRTWTWSGWVKRGNLGINGGLVSAYSDANNWGVVQFLSTGVLNCFSHRTSSVQNGDLNTVAVYRDPCAWYHAVIAVDTTQVTSTDRVKCWINATQQTLTGTYPTQNTDTWFNSTAAHSLGRYGGASNYFDGYMAEIHFVDGQALTPSSFGEFDSNGIWRPIQVSGLTYGTNGFYLSFADNTSTTTLGYDDAGSNDWTLNNFSVAAGAGNDSLEDTPTSNFCVISPIDQNGFALSNGGLTVTSAANNLSSRGSFGMSGGKWAWEVTRADTDTDSAKGWMCGIVLASQASAAAFYNTADSYLYFAWSGDRYTSGSSSAGGASWRTSGDIIRCEFDADAGTLAFFKNGTLQFTISGIPSGTYVPVVTRTGGTTSTAVDLNFGQRAFAYTPPTGFSALCTANLPAVTDASLYLKGNKPALLWAKGRSGATHHKWIDTTRGPTLNLSSSSTSAETGEATVLNVDKYGIRLGDDADINTAAATYVMWGWVSGTTPGFNITTYTGDGTTNRNISHGLGTTPHFAVVKSRATGAWHVYHRSLTSAAHYLKLDLNEAQSNVNTPWGTGNWTSSQFMVSAATNSANASATEYIAYLWTEVTGFSKFGSYVGNGSASGPFVWCGARPKYLLVKGLGASGSGWIIYDTSRDPYNVATKDLRADLANAEPVSSGPFDILSNGFKLRGTDTNSNSSSTSYGPYIFAAFAEFPVQYANAR